MPNNNALSQSFEHINQAGGQVPSQVAAGLKDVAKAATVDVVKGVAKAPLDALKSLLGADSGNKANETNTAASNVDPGIEDLTGGSSLNQTASDDAQADLQRRMEKKRTEAMAKIQQHRQVLKEWENASGQLQQEEEQRKQHQEQQDAQNKAQIRQIQQEKQQQAAWKQAIAGRTGAHEGLKKAG